MQAIEPAEPPDTQKGGWHALSALRDAAEHNHRWRRGQRAVRKIFATG